MPKVKYTNIPISLDLPIGSHYFVVNPVGTGYYKDDGTVHESFTSILSKAGQHSRQRIQSADVWAVKSIHLKQVTNPANTGRRSIGFSRVGNYGTTSEDMLDLDFSREISASDPTGLTIQVPIKHMNASNRFTSISSGVVTIIVKDKPAVFTGHIKQRIVA